MSKIKPYLNDSRGMTLVEVLVVTLVIGIMAGLALPAGIKTIDKFKLRNTANELRANIRLTQQMSISQRISPYISIFVETNMGPKNMYVIKKNYSTTIKSVQLPEGIALKSSSFKNARISFGTMGNTTDDLGGAIALVNKQGDTLYVVVVAPTGRVRIDTKPPDSWIK